MARVDWRLKGEWVKNCNCAFGCPCDFNARPTHGECRGMVGMHITEGHFGDVQLDGISFCATVDFPGPLHEGNGSLQPIIDERATPQQREALFGIMSGQNSAEGTMFHIFSLIVTKMLDPIFAPIKFDFDLPGRRAKVSIPGVLETESVKPLLIWATDPDLPHTRRTIRISDECTVTIEPNVGYYETRPVTGFIRTQLREAPTRVNMIRALMLHAFAVLDEVESLTEAELLAVAEAYVPLTRKVCALPARKPSTPGLADRRGDVGSVALGRRNGGRARGLRVS